MDGLFNYAKYAQKPIKGALRQKNLNISVRYSVMMSVSYLKILQHRQCDIMY